MVIEALQNYAQLASGLTKTTRARAVSAAKVLIAQAGLGDVAAETSERVSKLADDIVATSKANRQLLANFVAHEVDKAVARMGLARIEDLDALRRDIVDLRAAQLGDPMSARDPVRKRTAAATKTAKAAAGTTPAKKAAAKKAAVGRATVTKPEAKRSTTRKTPAVPTSPPSVAAPTSATADASIPDVS
jgi:hypothetical protein